MLALSHHIVGSFRRDPPKPNDRPDHAALMIRFNAGNIYQPSMPNSPNDDRSRDVRFLPKADAFNRLFRPPCFQQLKHALRSALPIPGDVG